MDSVDNGDNLWITGIERLVMLIGGKDADVVHCIHCSPRIWWIENDAGKPPQFAYSGLPERGQIVLSKNTIEVVCRSCALQTAIAVK